MKLEEEIARLNALVAMQAGALEMALLDVYSNEWVDVAKEALSATAETVSAYQNEVKAKALESVKSKLRDISDGYDNSTEYGEGRVDSVDLCLDAIDELRAKGE